MNYPIPQFSSEIKNKAKNALNLATDWVVNSQITHAWPYWTADTGRFASVRSIRNPDMRVLYSICWSTARASQALVSAYLITGRDDALEAARRAMRFVDTCQIDSRFLPEKYQGGCREETPLCEQIAYRDTIEAVQGYISLYLATKEKKYLDRAVFSADFIFRMHREIGTFPHHYYDVITGEVLPCTKDWGRVVISAEALMFSQLNKLLGEERYSREAFDSIDWVIENLLGSDGSMKNRDEYNSAMAHHVIQDGPFTNVITNDDGFGVALIAAYRVKGDEKYREAALRYGKWWLEQKEMPPKYSSITSVFNFLLDMYRFTGDSAYAEKALAYMERTLELQSINPGVPEVHGGFRGHECSCSEEEELYPGDPLNYISLRTTMYAMMALGKVAAENEDQWNCAYSGFGW